MARTPRLDRFGTLPVPRFWMWFALGWLVVVILVAWRLPDSGLTPSRLAGSFTCLALLTVLYVWLTLRDALTVADLTAEGPPISCVRRRVAILAAMAALVFAFAVIAPGLEVWWLMMHPVVAAGLALPPASAAAAMCALVSVGFGAGWIADGRMDPMFLLQATFGASAIAFRHLTTTVAQLRRAREELARAAVNEERLRFARDLHDLLGHSLSTIVLKSELAGRLARQAPNRAAVEMADVERTARTALHQVRTAVAGYRRPSLGNELAAARELLAAAGIAARIDGAAASLPPAVDGLLGWTVREGVTNVIRHSGARSCTIRLARSAEYATAEIADDGSGAGESGAAGGNGLIGLAERAAAQGARLDAGPRAGGGFRLAVDVPLNGSAGANR